jgi:hypothetical protein
MRTENSIRRGGKIEDTKAVIRSRRSKIPKRLSEAVDLRRTIETVDGIKDVIDILSLLLGVV